MIHNYLIDSVGNLALKKITKITILDFFKDLEDRKVAPSVQRTLFYIIKSSLLLAAQEKRRKYLDLSDISLKSVKKQIDVLEKQEQKILESFLLAKPNIRKICVLLCLYAGLRIGEVCGLQWADINFESNTITIKKTILRVKNDQESLGKTKLIASLPKSSNSMRTIPVPEFIMEQFKKYKMDNSFYILSRSEKMYDPRILEDSFNRMLKKCRLRHVNFHVLRHTFATRCIEAKVDIKTLSELLGHSTIEITLKTYVHSSNHLKKESIDSLVSFMQMN